MKTIKTKSIEVVVCDICEADNVPIFQCGNCGRDFCSNCGIMFTGHDGRTNMNVSLDSCLLNWIINSECVFTRNYIDVSYDGSLRKCPYNKDGITLAIEDRDHYNQMNDQCDSTSCYYCKRFKKD